MEKVEERYLRWIFLLDRKAPGYLVREEIQREKLRERAGKRTWEFEKRLEESKGSKLARICWEELKGRSKEGKTRSKWKVERRKFFEDRRWMIGEMEKKREERESWFSEIIRKDREIQKVERKWERILNSKFSK